MSIFEPQLPENSEPISVMLESEFIRDHEQVVEHSLNSVVYFMEQRLYFLRQLEIQHEFQDHVADWMELYFSKVYNAPSFGILPISSHKY